MEGPPSMSSRSFSDKSLSASEKGRKFESGVYLKNVGQVEQWAPKFYYLIGFVDEKIFFCFASSVGTSFSF